MGHQAGLNASDEIPKAVGVELQGPYLPLLRKVYMDALPPTPTEPKKNDEVLHRHKLISMFAGVTISGGRTNRGSL